MPTHSGCGQVSADNTGQSSAGKFLDTLRLAVLLSQVLQNSRKNFAKLLVCLESAKDKQGLQFSKFEWLFEPSHTGIRGGGQHGHCTLRFGSTADALAKRLLNYCGILWCNETQTNGTGFTIPIRKFWNMQVARPPDWGGT